MDDTKVEKLVENCPSFYKEKIKVHEKRSLWRDVLRKLGHLVSVDHK